MFLSRGGRLVLLKVVLQSITVYWASIAYIPKAILTKKRKMCFLFLWTLSKKNEGTPLTKWKTIALPKELGGWGIKNPMLFCRALAAKSLWRIFQNTNTLWGRVMCSKCWNILNPLITYDKIITHYLINYSPTSLISWYPLAP